MNQFITNFRERIAPPKKKTINERISDIWAKYVANNDITLNSVSLNRGLLATLFVSLGLIYAEKAIETPSNFNTLSGFGFFLFGWFLFLSTQDTQTRKYGMAVLAIAVIGQIYMAWLIRSSAQNPTFARKNVLLTAGIWIAFIGSWLLYAHKMTLGKDNKRFIVPGLALVALSMMGYFFYRKHDWSTLTGGIIPSIPKDGSIFNQFVILFPIGWALLAVGNSIQQ